MMVLLRINAKLEFAFVSIIPVREGRDAEVRFQCGDLSTECSR